MVGIAARMLITTCVATCLLLGGTRAAAQAYPYTLETRRDVGLTAAGLALLIASFPVLSAQEPLTPADIDALDPVDIIAGALLGASAGYVVPKLHEVSPVYVAPSEGGLAVGVTIQF